ncbi:MAG: hypothetical protein ABI158_06505, partial [Edaphobacter sp.]
RSFRGGGGLVGLLLGFVAFAEERKCHAGASLAMAVGLRFEAANRQQSYLPAKPKCNGATSQTN